MMLNNMPIINGDPLWALLGRFRADQRKHKIDLLVGVYRDKHGNTPVMKTVQDAEIHLAHEAHSKAYGMLSGNANFNQQMAKFVLGDSPSLNNQCTIQTVGASGALRLIADFIAILSPDSTVWISDPGYINHRPLMEGAGLTVDTYPWQNKNGRLDIDACFAALEKAKEGDVLLLHACCHNPTGIDPSLEQWQLFSDKCKQKNIVPFIDM
ncbi:MAG: aminotransferase class I/II-fold pyridoxal phosphate-dependent enzyme, partial [Psychrobacter sp.]